MNNRHIRTERPVAEILSEIREKQKEIHELEALLPFDEDRDADGYLNIMPVFRADMSADFAAIQAAMKLNLALKPEFNDCVMDWDQFAADVRTGCLTDYDGFGDLMLDGDVAENAVLYLAMESLYIYDAYLIPFDRIPALFEGHDVKVVWFNK